MVTVVNILIVPYTLTRTRSNTIEGRIPKHLANSREAGNAKSWLISIPNSWFRAVSDLGRGLFFPLIFLRGLPPSRQPTLVCRQGNAVSLNFVVGRAFSIYVMVGAVGSLTMLLGLGWVSTSCSLVTNGATPGNFFILVAFVAFSEKLSSV